MTIHAFALLAAMRIPESDAVNATATVQHVLKAADLDASMAYEKPYVVVFWDASSEHGAGEALLKMGSDHSWTIVKMTTGSLKSVDVLKGLGVPATTAQALVNDLTQFKAR
ncbi:MAG: hypothetical protein JO029_14445 [Candidatus Eremiobacteraeota bacterium]|nr:hypothetical protein [Candidatus Eremiobacteraeota bacterium]MBV8435475.1 hypothetical protein [Candidatus Eremiobacteraeota bacterium]